jgi:hypothetical protein
MKSDVPPTVPSKPLSLQPMKLFFTITIIIVGAAVVPPVVRGAPSTYGRELDDLQKQHSQAVVAAVEPLNRRYQASLEQLLKKATQANDLDTALRIRKSLEAADLLPKGVTRTDFAGQWTVTYPDGAKFTRDLEADGSYVTSTGKKGKWTATDQHLTLKLAEDQWERFDLPFRGGTLKGATQSGQALMARKQ